MERWHLPSIEAIGKREPRVLFSDAACRAVIIDLQAGEAMGEHSVHETAILQVITGTVAIGSGNSVADCPAGTLATFAPGERHTVQALEASRLVLLLAPWPGDGHYQTGEDADPERLPAHASTPPLSA